MTQPTSTGHQRPQSSPIESITSTLTDSKIHLLVAASGSVATIKLPLIVKTLAARYSQSPPSPSSSLSSTHSSPPRRQLSIRILLTPSSTRFLQGQSPEQPPLSSLLAIPGVDGIHLDEDEWSEPWKRGNAILHIELRRWADMLVIAPLSANTMAKIVGGFADGILTSVVRAWDARGELDNDFARFGGAAGDDGNRSVVVGTETVGGTPQTTASTTTTTTTVSSTALPKERNRKKKKRIIVAPAMNTAMWRHPVTEKQLRVLEEEWGVAPTNNQAKERRRRKDDGLGDPAGSDSGNYESVEDAGERQSGSGQQLDGEGESDGWFEVLRPQHKILACGDVGDGAMMEWTDIVAVIEDRLGLTEPVEEAT